LPGEVPLAHHGVFSLNELPESGQEENNGMPPTIT
jgi:predicted ATPase with chaperone activity